ncbi:magnesium chelatase domain-containing protein [Streptomyces smyrnaeus]|uniref:magnesium chelatase domain-containing protein n=1 Tax=Streptomyces smyrnaeus TaxID=1387713 RepID=UPI0036899F6B
MSANNNTETTETREFIIVGQDQGTSFTLWDVAPAPTNAAKRLTALEEIDVDAVDAFGQVHTEWATSARAAVDQLLTKMRDLTGIDDYGLSPDSRMEAYGPAGDATPNDSIYGDAKSASAAGNTAYVVEAWSTPGLPTFNVKGLPGPHVNEIRDRVRAGTVNSGWTWPQSNLLIRLHLAASTHPAGKALGKSTSALDLAIACTALAASGRLDAKSLNGVTLIGELGLDGTVRVPNGLRDLVQAAADAGQGWAIVPGAGVDEARTVAGIHVLGVNSLNEAAALISAHHHHPAGCLHCTEPSGGHRPCTYRQPCTDCREDGIEPVGA